MTMLCCGHSKRLERTFDPALVRRICEHSARLSVQVGGVCRPTRCRAGRTEPPRTSPRVRVRRGRGERGHLLLLNLLHSRCKRVAVARDASRGHAEGDVGLRALEAHAPGGLAEAVEKLTFPRVRIEIEVPESHRKARPPVRPVLHGLARSCRE